MSVLSIKGLHASVDDREILCGLDLEVDTGEVHAIMGPNGSGKSTLSYTLAGRDGYEVTKGKIRYKEEDLTEMSPEDRAGAGLFLAFQYPVEIPGVPTTTFLKEALNAVRRYRGEEELDAMAFIKLVREKTKELDISDDMLKRAVNVGFSGGEKKRNEILQMITLEPHLATLDETDSGLDIDALKIVAEGVNNYRTSNRSFILITHYQRILNYMQPDFVHVLMNGKLVKSGTMELAKELEKKGYSWIEDELAGAV